MRARYGPKSRCRRSTTSVNEVIAATMHGRPGWVNSAAPTTFVGCLNRAAHTTGVGPGGPGLKKR